MPEKMLNQRPNARCYICHAPNVEKVCHHCGRAICGKEKCKSTRLPIENLFPNGEFMYLDLENITGDPEVIHCKICAEKLHGKRWYQRFLKALFTRQSYCLPTKPTISTVSATETIKVQVRTDAAGKYSVTQIEEPKGELKIACQFADNDHKRWEIYRKQKGLSASENIPFHAGFAVLQGLTATSKLKLVLPKEFACPSAIDTIALKGKTGEQDFLKDGVSPSLWELPIFTYTLIGADDKPVKLPIQITLTLVPDQTQRALELVVQLLPDAEFESASIEKLTLQAPTPLQKIVKTEPGTPLPPASAVGTSVPPDLSVTWKGLNLAFDKTKVERRRSFWVHFKNKLEPTMQIQGNLKINLKGTLSGLKDVKFFYAWGKLRQEEIKVKRQTQIEIDFVLDLASLHFQKLPPPEPIECSIANVRLDADKVANLTESLNEAGIYVKRVIEHPLRISRDGADATTRFWEIGGRYYLGVHPLDVRLTLIGQEKSAIPVDSSVDTAVLVQSVLPNAVTTAEIIRLRDEVIKRVKATLV